MVPLHTMLAAVAMLVAAPTTPRPLVVWNVSASVPTGLYSIAPALVPSSGELAVARLPEPARTFAARRGYLPDGVPLIKPVAAKANDRVCVERGVVAINGRPVARRLRRDRQNRAMPSGELCRRLAADEVLLLAPHSADSFDGRYFGPLHTSAIVGRARLLWAY